MPFAKPYALSFLDEKSIASKMEVLIKKKLRTQSKTRIGDALGIGSNTSIEKLPLTSYEFYRKYFESPSEGDLIYPLGDYVKAITSGTMGKPKSFLLPKTGLQDNLMKTGFTVMLLGTHDGEKITFEAGDTVYRNVPGGSHIAVFLTNLFEKNDSGWVKQCPDSDLPFQTKVDYFVDHYKEIDVAYMTVPTLLEEVYPRIGKPIHLKGFMTQDTAAGAFKEKIREVTGGYPKSNYGATETMFCSMPSIEHPGAFLLDWRVIYPEFIPEKEKIEANTGIEKEAPDMLTLTQVEAGKMYQLVATPLKNDMTRYVMPDIFECVDTCDDVLGASMPVFRYHMRADRLIMLHNFTRIVENELIDILHAAGVPFVDFTARKTSEGIHDYMELYIELKEKGDVAALTKQIDDKLMEVDKDWRDLSHFLKYTPLKVNLLPRGTFHKYLASQTGMPRVERIGMSDERFAGLISKRS
ncbi:TPA: GH3 auxin-responsive promoter family protein [Candidatus Bathyarchaeota archaeon]|nr:GH3 auxin-responsive promoter family protein [Candidatus Bathyarchaeota archaeon]